MKPLSCQEIRDLWVEYFTKKCPSAHKHIKSASLVPDNPTLLLNAAGMVQFVPIFMGTKPPPEPPRAVTVQKCARVGGKDSDLENIGRTTRHHSFFEMLGNFSFGDYFKEDAIKWAWQFVTEELCLDKDKLYVSVFEGDEQNAFDQEAYDTWKKIIDEKRIWKMTRKDNFWGPPGASGPCGPCSEIYYEVDPSAKEFDDRYTEIWNLVFMEFNKDEEGKFTALASKNIDTGAGLERIATIIQGVKNTFETDELKRVFDSIKEGIECDIKSIESVQMKYESDDFESKQNIYQTNKELHIKIITDHLRCSCFLIADGVRPSADKRGSVLRMLIRRAHRFAYLQRNYIEKPFLFRFVEEIAKIYSHQYPELENSDEISNVIKKEEERFLKTLREGENRLRLIIADAIRSKLNLVSGYIIHDLYATYGFPQEVSKEVLEAYQLNYDLNEYLKAEHDHAIASGKGDKAKSVEANSFIADILKKHGKTKFLGFDGLETKAKVLYASDNKVVLDQTTFYAESGGQLADIGTINGFKVKNVKAIEGITIHTVEDSSKFKISDEVTAKVDSHNRDYTKKHHTSCHLLQAALRKTLGDSIQQMGSQVGPEYTRFDFNLDRAMTKEEIKKVEDQINSWIKEDFTVETKVMDYEDAVKAGALSFFEDKYEDEVRVLFIDKASIELCGGIHVNKLSEIKNITIASEGSVASGIRRIKLLANTVADEYLKELKLAQEKLAQEEAQRALEKEAQKAKTKEEQKELLSKLDEIYQNSQIEDNVRLQILNTNEVFKKEFSSDALKSFIEALIDKNKSSGNSFFIFSASICEDKLVFFSACSDDLATKDSVYNAGNIVKEAAKLCGGGGGGRPNFAQAGGKDLSKIQEAIKMVTSVASKIKGTT
jgi:alanyl-tRNA synthetase